MLKLQIPKNRMNYLINQAQTHFDSVHLERGWAYFHQGKVTGAELVHGTTIQALIKGTKNYEVMINLEDFTRSECSCSYDGFCKHMAAAFFSLYAPFGRPELLLQQLKQAILVKSKTSRASALRSNKSNKKTDKPAAPMAGSLPQEWHRFFEGQFYGYSISHQASIESFYTSAFDTLAPFAKTWREPMQLLFQLHIVLFIMRRIEQFYQDTKSSYLSHYHENGCKITGAQCKDKLVKIIQGFDPQTTFVKEAKVWEATLSMLGDMALHGKESPMDWLFIYRFIWWGVTSGKGWKEEELARLDTLLIKNDLTPRRRDVLIIARAHFDVMNGNREKAFARLNGLQKRNATDYFLYLRYAHQNDQWPEMLEWLRWLLPTMPQASQDDFRQLCQYWMDAAKHLEADTEWVQVMESLLPRSYYHYTTYLLQTKRYKQWVDLQLANRISPLNLYAMELRAVEEVHPELLLPLYHQSAERVILEKNRASYKIAIKLLKKLHGYYKSMQRQSEWEDYIYRLSDKFSRLRAFQEELQKGKWIP